MAVWVAVQLGCCSRSQQDLMCMPVQDAGASMCIYQQFSCADTLPCCHAANVECVQVGWHSCVSIQLQACTAKGVGGARARCAADTLVGTSRAMAAALSVGCVGRVTCCSCTGALQQYMPCLRCYQLRPHGFVWCGECLADAGTSTRGGMTVQWQHMQRQFLPHS
jgi:hypothetical protein